MPPTTLEGLKEQLAALRQKDRIVLVGEFYHSHSSILDALTADQMAELMGVEYYHRASLTLKSRGHKIVFSTKYNDAEDQRSVTIG